MSEIHNDCILIGVVLLLLFFVYNFCNKKSRNTNCGCACSSAPPPTQQTPSVVPPVVPRVVDEKFVSPSLQALSREALYKPEPPRPSKEGIVYLNPVGSSMEKTLNIMKSSPVNKSLDRYPGY